ncbi:MAG: tryptophan--tRNA ligase [Gammaproteobacteria bacterium]
MSTATSSRRVLSGMRPTGRLHLGHYHGVLKNWVALQSQHECFFFVADWHALTTHYDDPAGLQQHVFDMVVDWLAAGVDPDKATLFVQSQVPEHAELHVLLSMITPLGWLERVPTYKDQQEKLKEKDLATYGFLGYPLLQSADILVYRAGLVPVGADQVAHVEITREVARRFNQTYGREPGFAEKVAAAIEKLGKKPAKIFVDQRRAWQEKGDAAARDVARELVSNNGNVGGVDRERLLGDLDGSGKIILPEPQALLTPESKMPGLDGQKMSKSYHNTISLREEPAEVETRLRRMPTDPARVRRTDVGNPDNCPVWQLHEVYSGDDVKQWVRQGCTSAGIGCIECKQPVIDAVNRELAPMRERAQHFAGNPAQVRSVLERGREQARAAAAATMVEVRAAMGLA